MTLLRFLIEVISNMSLGLTLLIQMIPNFSHFFILVGLGTRFFNFLIHICDQMSQIKQVADS